VQRGAAAKIAQDMRYLAAKGVAEPSQDELRTMFSGVAASLRNHVGKAVSVDDSKSPLRWALSKESGCASSKVEHFVRENEHLQEITT
jgi:hypothetical protein